MIRFLKSNLLLSPFLLFGLTILLRIKGLLSPVGYQLTGTEGPLYLLVHGFMLNPYVESIFVSILIFLEAYLVNRLVLQHNIIRPPNFLTAFFFIILSSLSVDFLGFHPVILANILVILALSELFKIYKLHKSAIHIFNAGLLLAIAGLIYMPVFIFYFACSIIILVLRSYNFIERLQLFLGFLTPVYLYSIYKYLDGSLSDFWSSYLAFSFQFPSFKDIIAEDMYIILIYTVITILSILSYRNFIIKKGIEIQKKIDGLFWISLFTFLSVFLVPGIEISHIMLMAFPLAAFMCMLIINIKQYVIVEFIGLVFLSLVPIIHFFVM